MAVDGDGQLVLAAARQRRHRRGRRRTTTTGGRSRRSGSSCPRQGRHRYAGAAAAEAGSGPRRHPRRRAAVDQRGERADRGARAGGAVARSADAGPSPSRTTSCWAARASPACPVGGRGPLRRRDDVHGRLRRDRAWVRCSTRRASRRPSRRGCASRCGSGSRTERRRCSCSTPACAPSAPRARRSSTRALHVYPVHSPWMDDPKVGAIDDEDESDDDGSRHARLRGRSRHVHHRHRPADLPGRRGPHRRRAVELRRR